LGIFVGTKTGTGSELISFFGADGIADITTVFRTPAIGIGSLGGIAGGKKDISIIEQQNE
jgi:hypothetical protein